MVGLGGEGKTAVWCYASVEPDSAKKNVDRRAEEGKILDANPEL